MMGLFGASAPFDSDVEKATSEKNTTDQWGVILDVCDKAGKSSEEARNCLRAVLKRLSNPDPHIAIQAATLLDACVSNSGKVFHVEIASREFENEYCKLIKKGHPKVIQKLKESLKKWAEGEFKNDQQLNLIPSLYAKLKSGGVEFPTEMPAKKSVVLSKDPNVVQSQDEEDQIAKAIQLSLKETSGSPRNTGASSSTLYPSTNLSTTNAGAASHGTVAKELRKVRALYDFEAAEDNELTFSSGEIIFVVDDSDPNWWKGSNQRGEGLFPASFVTADLSVEPEQLMFEKTKKVQFNETVEVKPSEKELEDVEINEGKIDRLLHLLHEADPTNPDQDSQEMIKLEREVNGMGPLIDTELERVDRKHAQLTQLSSDLVEALGLYHSLMREPQYPTLGKVPYGYPHPSSVIYNGVPPQSVPSYMGQQYGGGPHQDHRNFIPQGVPPGLSLPPHMQMPPPGLGGSVSHIPHGHVLPNSLPPHASQQQLPQVQSAHLPGGHMMTPNMHMPPQTQDDQRTLARFPQGVPNYGPQSMPPQFSSSAASVIGQHNSNTGPQSGQFPPSSNTHIM